MGPILDHFMIPIMIPIMIHFGTFFLHCQHRKSSHGFFVGRDNDDIFELNRGMILMPCDDGLNDNGRERAARRVTCEASNAKCVRRQRETCGVSGLCDQWTTAEKILYSRMLHTIEHTR